jgi:hypothetical protein
MERTFRGEVVLREEVGEPEARSYEAPAEEVAEILREATRLAETLHIGREVMNARDAAEFMDMSPASFSRMAPELPRCRISDKRFLYLREDLLEWLRAKTEAPTWWHRRGRNR